MTGPHFAAEGVRILLVEDNVDDVQVLRRLLQRLPGSFHVEVAYDGREAVELAQRRSYDLALVDQNLPDQPGQAIIQALHELGEGLPVVMLTGHGDERLAVEVMKAGAYDYLRKDELDRRSLGQVLRNVLERARLEAEVRRANARLRDWAIRDGLTGLYNHRHFQELLRTEFARARRYQQTLALLMIDLDHFKQVNDTYGHPVGDAVLRKVASTIAEQARQVDIIARYGGEEFVVVLPNTSREGASAVAERAREAVGEQLVDFDGVRVTVTISVGVATSADVGVEHERDLVKRADAALYRAKRSGRNQVRIASASEESIFDTPPPASRGEAPADAEVRRRMLRGLSTLVDMAEIRDGQPGHSKAVAERADRLAAAYGMGPMERKAARVAARLHDVGRLGISDLVLAKAGPLDAVEQDKLRMHPLLGAEVLARCGFSSEEVEAVRSHHERWDGNGYPQGLQGEDIPVLARLISIVDGFEALSSSRAWRPARTPEEALRTVQRGAGTFYDPALVDTFVSSLGRLQIEEAVAEDDAGGPD